MLISLCFGLGLFILKNFTNINIIIISSIIIILECINEFLTFIYPNKDIYRYIIKSLSIGREIHKKYDYFFLSKNVSKLGENLKGLFNKSSVMYHTNYDPIRDQINNHPPQNNVGQPVQNNAGQPVQNNAGQPVQNNAGQPVQPFRADSWRSTVINNNYADAIRQYNFDGQNLTLKQKRQTMLNMLDAIKVPGTTKYLSESTFSASGRSIFQNFLITADRPAYLSACRQGGVFRMGLIVNSPTLRITFSNLLTGLHIP